MDRGLLRVLQVVHTFLPESHTGTEIHTLELCQALNQSGEVTPLVFAPRVKDGVVPGTLEKEEVDGIPVVRICHPETLRPDRNPLVEAGFKQVLDQWKPHLIHFQHCAWGGERLPQLAAEAGVPSVYTLHDYWGICPRSTLLTVQGELCPGPGTTGARCLDQCWLERPGRRTLRKAAWGLDSLTGHRLPVLPALSGLREGRMHLEGWVGRPHRLQALMEFPTAFIAPSKHVAQRYGAWGLETERLERIPHGVNAAWARDLPSPPVRAEADAVRFGFIGTPLPHKGLHLLIEAFSRLPQGGATLTIHAHLDDPANPYALELGIRCASLPGITVAGRFPRERLGQVFQGMDVLVVPSVWEEMFGLVVLEARLAGVAVVVSEMGGLPELVRNRVDGLVVPPDRVDPLHGALKRFVDEPALARRLAGAAPPTRTMQECAAETARLYARVSGRWTGARWGVESPTSPPRKGE
ncbi:MAG: glycosyltransferase [Gemmatimonadota bacterium]